MTVELRPLGVACNIQCQYCYQHPQRDAGNVATSYDIARMKAALLAEGRPFSLFGGEPLLIPEADLEELWAWGLQHFGRNAVQTNGSLITDRHITLFKKYRVSVGISIDGPGALNDIRWAGSLAKTREATARTEGAIEKLCREGIPPGLVITLHRGNATSERLPTLHQWLHHLAQEGTRSARLHLLESENDEIRNRFSLSPKENTAALLSFYERPHSIKFDLFRDVRALLVGHDQRTSCVWNACDTYATKAVHGVEGQGQRSNCGRTNKEGVDFVKADSQGFERYLALYHTPQSAGGCAGCRFFLACKGQCPGTAIDGDWRNRTEHCETWKALLSAIESALLKERHVPLSRTPLRAAIESRVIRSWERGQAITVSSVIEQLRNA
jgi:uncharacterized protein